jgi:hypothetical protein
MKFLMDRGEPVILPEPFHNGIDTSTLDRDVLGRQFLRGFLYDGKIRGLTKSGEVYEHHISHPLAQKFIRELPATGVRGCKN